LTVSVALALTSVACVHLIGSSGILAAFVAGLLFKRFLARAEDPHHERVQKAIGRFFDLPVLALFGLSVPWRDWLALDRAAWLFVLAVLLLRRPPVWLLLRPVLPSLAHRCEALFNGWFGPIGILRRRGRPPDPHRSGVDRRQPRRIRLDRDAWHERHPADQALPAPVCRASTLCGDDRHSPGHRLSVTGDVAGTSSSS
jgi:hypothetical protein